MLSLICFIGLIVAFPSTIYITRNRPKYIQAKEFVKEYEKGNGYLRAEFTVQNEFSAEYSYDITCRIYKSGSVGMVDIDDIDYLVYKNDVCLISRDINHHVDTCGYGEKCVTTAMGGGDIVELNQYDNLTLIGNVIATFNVDGDLIQENFDLFFEFQLQHPYWVDTYVSFFLSLGLLLIHILGIGLSLIFLIKGCKKK